MNTAVWVAPMPGGAGCRIDVALGQREAVVRRTMLACRGRGHAGVSARIRVVTPK